MTVLIDLFFSLISQFCLSVSPIFSAVEGTGYSLLFLPETHLSCTIFLPQGNSLNSLS